ncbi:MAG: hypothetical protein QXI39_00635 [Candidatus Bathyarchaeia archaeon]
MTKMTPTTKKRMLRFGSFEAVLAGRRFHDTLRGFDAILNICL